MGKEKESDLWDDSALINAFNQSISKYKKMHNKGHKENTITIPTDSSDFPTSLDVSLDYTNSNPETHDLRDYGDSNAITKVAERESLETDTGIEVVDSVVERESQETNKGIEVVDSQILQEHPNYSTSQDMDEYNQLYKQYYEIEEERQKILQKMQNFNNWNYSYHNEAPVSGLQCAPNSGTQEYQSCANQAPCGSMVVSCPCSCPLSGVCGNNLCVDPLAMKDPEKNPSVENSDIVRTAMGAAERAILTLKDKTYDSKENDASKQKVTSGTDLSTVLNAWYSAGFYTGKYLTEQSLAKKQHDSAS